MDIIFSHLTQFIVLKLIYVNSSMLLRTWGRQRKLEELDMNMILLGFVSRVDSISRNAQTNFIETRCSATQYSKDFFRNIHFSSCFVVILSRLMHFQEFISSWIKISIDIWTLYREVLKIYMRLVIERQGFLAM